MDHPLDVLIGVWNTAGENVTDAGELAFSIRGTDEYEWLPGKKFLVHYADVRMGDEKVDVLEVVGPCGDDLTAIPMHAFDGAYTLMHAKLHWLNIRFEKTA